MYLVSQRLPRLNEHNLLRKLRKLLAKEYERLGGRKSEAKESGELRWIVAITFLGWGGREEY